jgi:hypothetical protein
MSSHFLRRKFEKVLEFARMKKDSRLTFRVRSDLKRKLEAIAARESRSVAQICETFLMTGAEAYRKEGSRYIQRLLAKPSDE